MTSHRVRGVLALLAILTACAPTSSAHLDPPAERSATWATTGYEIDPAERVVAYEHTSTSVLDLDDPDRPVDADGVLQVAWPGEDEPIYHPVGMAMFGLNSYESYRFTGEPEFLRRAEANAAALLDGATEIDGALWFGYRFDHSLRDDDNMTLRAPWYSGMAQGQVLSLVSRLYHETGDEEWREAADAILASYAVNSPRTGPWFAQALDGNLWLEEYPDTTGAVPDTQVINGHIYSAWGLYDYYTLIAADPEVLELFDAAATTMLATFDDYRVPGGISYYCASRYCSDVGWQPENYHRGVAAQLDMLAEMTGDSAFADRADVLRRDYIDAGGTG